MNYEEAKNLLEKLNKKGGGGKRNFFEIPDWNPAAPLESQVRILIPPGGQWYHQLCLHYLPGGVCDCLWESEGENCPICELVAAGWDSTPEVRRWKKNFRYLMNVIPRSINEVKILSAGKQLFSSILLGSMDQELGENPDVVLSSRDFSIRKLDKNGITNYESSRFCLVTSPVGDPEQVAGWMENLFDLSSQGSPKSPDEMLKLIHKKSDDIVGN